MIVLKRIKLQDFTCHWSLDIVFRKAATFIVGENGAGKSSVKDAFEFCLTGAARSTDAGGRGFDSLIRTGAAAMSVSAEYDIWRGLREVAKGNPGRELIITRRASAKGTELEIEGWQGGRQVLESKLYGLLGVTRQQIHALLNSTYFFDLSLAEQKTLLLEARGLEFDWSELWRRVKGINPAAYESGYELFDDSIEIKALHGSALIGALSKHVYQARRDEKRKLKDLKGELAEAVLPEGTATGDLEEMRNLLGKLRQERDDLKAEQGKREAGQTERENLKDEIARLGNKRDEKQKALADAEKRVAGAGEAQKAVSDLDAALRSAWSEKSKHERNEAELSAEEKSLAENIRAFKADPGKCLVIPELKCAVSKDGSKVMASLEAKLEKVRAKVIKATEAKEKATNQVAALEGELEQARDKLDSPTPDYIEGLKKDLAELDDTIEAKSLRHNELVKADRASDEDPSERLAKLDSRIIDGEAKIEAVVRAEEVERQNKSRAEKLASQEEQVAVLEELVTLFGPTGIMKDILAEKIGPFQKTVNAATEVLMDGQYEIGFEFEPDFAIGIRKANQHLPVAGLSASERLRLGVAIQVALAEAVGFPLIIVDGADMLYGHSRLFFSNLMDRLAANDVQVIVLASGEVPTDAPEAVAYVDLGAGSEANGKENGRE